MNLKSYRSCQKGIGLTRVSKTSIIFSFAARTSSNRPATFICGSAKKRQKVELYSDDCVGV